MAQHVTFWRMKVQPGKINDLKAVMTARQEEARLKATGWVQTIVGERKEGSDEIWGVVTWDTSDNYYKNAESPDQNQWYEKMRSFLAAEPEWFDCDVVEDARA
jgi:antibiotic biosynthesis monooxygenase (ABM) superfamily enzyme